MNRTILALCLIFTLSLGAHAQKYVTKTGYIRFYSHTPVEDIEAKNTQVNAALEPSTGAFTFKVLIKSFEFEKALMQEHFNDNFMESGQFPNANFSGKVVNMKSINLNKPGTYTADVEGDLTIHGVTKKISTKGSFEISGANVNGKAKFQVKPADYNIKIPAATMSKIAESLEVTVEVDLVKLNK